MPHVSLTDLLLILGVALAVGTACHALAVALAARGWARTAHALDIASTVLLDGVRLARQIAGATGRTLDVPTVAQTIELARQKAEPPSGGAQ